MLAHAYNIITDRGVGEAGRVGEVIYGLNDTDNSFL